MHNILSNLQREWRKGRNKIKLKKKKKKVLLSLNLCILTFVLPANEKDLSGRIKGINYKNAQIEH